MSQCFYADENYQAKFHFAAVNFFLVPCAARQEHEDCEAGPSRIKNRLLLWLCWNRDGAAFGDWFIVFGSAAFQGDPETSGIISNA